MLYRAEIEKGFDNKSNKTDASFSEVLKYFSESLMGIEDEEAVLWDLAKNCISQLGFIDCVVYLIDVDRQKLIQKAAYGPKNPKDFDIYNPIEIPIGKGIVGNVANTGKAELIADTSKDKRYKEDDEFRFSEICVPILIKSEVIGVIDCEHPEKNFFTDHHLKMLSVIASITALKLKSVRTHKNYIEEQKRYIEIQNQLTELRLKALSTQMNPHFVFNSINAIQYFITSGDKKSALNYLSTFSKLIRFYLKHLELDYVGLHNEIEMLNWYLKLQKLRYSNEFNYNINIKGSPENAVIPCFVIQTLFENIIENGIYNQFKNQYLKSSFNIKNTEVRLKVEYSFDLPENKDNYKPEYRDSLIEWNNQIELLNNVNTYNIKKQFDRQITSKKSIENYTLILPNFYNKDE